MFTQVGYYFRKTKHFEPGKIRFKVMPILAPSQGASITMTEQEAIFVLARLISYIDGEQVDEEVEAIVDVFCRWPFFVIFTKEDSQFKEFLDRTFSLIKNNEIAELVNACFNKVSKKNRSLAYAAMLEVAYADRRLHLREQELLEVARARFSIENQIHQALAKSATIRFSM